MLLELLREGLAAWFIRAIFRKCAELLPGFKTGLRVKMTLQVAAIAARFLLSTVTPLSRIRPRPVHHPGCHPEVPVKLARVFFSARVGARDQLRCPPLTRSSEHNSACPQRWSPETQIALPLLASVSSESYEGI
jgi:hypothetical protein